MKNGREYQLPRHPPDTNRKLPTGEQRGLNWQMNLTVRTDSFILQLSKASNASANQPQTKRSDNSEGATSACDPHLPFRDGALPVVL